MPPTARLNDICTGHACWPPRPNVEGCATVMVNGRPLHCQGHAWDVHCCTHPGVPHGCHDSVLASGSGTVIAEGRQAGRIGDPVACGGNVATGSDNVIIGG